MSRAKKVEMLYDKENIFNTLDNLKITQERNNILTHYGDKLISNTVVSDKYKLFDFPTFAKKIIGEVENYFQPETYNMRITQGTQELRLIGEEVIINGDKYQKMFNILNSTDRSRSLQLNVGLIRFICSNGMVIALEDEYSGFKTKHFKSTMPGKVEEFIQSLDNFDMNINKQSERIENLMGNFVSYKDIVTKMMLDGDGILNDSKALKLNAFSKKLLSSETDKLNNLKPEQIKLLKNSTLFQSSEFNKVDIEMSAYNALNCWTEVYRNYDSSVLKRETNRILELV